MATNFVKILHAPITVYKVVRQEDNGSFHTTSLADHVSTIYRMNKEVVSSVEKTPIFTFKTLRAASAFKHTDHFILECVTRELYGNPLNKVLPSVALARISPERLYDFWCLPLEKERFMQYSTVYKVKQTILVASLIPVRVYTNAMLP